MFCVPTYHYGAQMAQTAGLIPGPDFGITRSHGDPQKNFCFNQRLIWAVNLVVSSMICKRFKTLCKQDY